ncbi:MAG: hypothetical protein EXR72_17850 [Myxococcales bacterium]|nr:hypothetical protein [Myxococcales bacterium]
MNTHTMIRIALPLLLLTGCGLDPALEEGIENGDERQALAGGLTYDTTSLTAIPAGTIPATRLPLSAFGQTVIQQKLIQSAEAFQPGVSGGGRSEFESPSFTFSTDASRGMTLALNKMDPGPAADQSETTLQTRATDRLKMWGIGASEIGPVWQRRMLGTSEDNGVVGAPARLAYKTFVLRSILGVRVDGHRAVVTHGLDGSFRRVIAKWPALAASGHLLHTRLTTTQIKSKATTAMYEAGFTTGQIKLRWKYLATAGSNGEVTLKLMVGARTAALVSNEVTEEPFEVNVDVSAIK